jgi:hypothetical protein
MLRRSSLVEYVSVLHGTCLQSVEFFFIRHYVQPCLSKNPKYTFYTIKSSLTLAYNKHSKYKPLHTCNSTSCFILVLFVLLILFFSMFRNVFETKVEYVGMRKHWLH